MCKRIEPIVHGLATEFAGKVECKVVPHNEGDSQQRIQRYGLDIHGMALTDQDDVVVWKESGHHQTRAGVVQALQKALGG